MKRREPAPDLSNQRRPASPRYIPPPSLLGIPISTLLISGVVILGTGLFMVRRRASAPSTAPIPVTVVAATPTPTSTPLSLPARPREDPPIDGARRPFPTPASGESGEDDGRLERPEPTPIPEALIEEAREKKAIEAAALDLELRTDAAGLADRAVEACERQRPGVLVISCSFRSYERTDGGAVSGPGSTIRFRAGYSCETEDRASAARQAIDISLNCRVVVAGHSSRVEVD